MNDRNWEQIETIIDQVLTLPEEKRESYIEYTCQDDNALKSEVTLLLESIFNSEGWLENPEDYKEDVLGSLIQDKELSPERSLIGTEIGSYRIKQKLGEGGMGSVYLAERADGRFEHQVAVKIIRSEKASAENIRRFEQERSIMAGLNHPGIAKLFDGGITEDDAPYFVMEYVDGIPIDEYCTQENCTLSERIDLFKQVLMAVRYAHENLVVHRDLKPGNILVNASGKVKILDFGISKLLQDDQTSAHLTQTSTRLLTPKYAAPEQILQLPITTATDIYALGIIFYKLLTNTYPLDLDELSQFEMEQTVLEKSPPKPSYKVSSSKPQRQLRGDLDAIALKAIRKEPEHRYRVANEFLDDLSNFQQGLPVTASEDSVKYRLQKFFIRHKQGAATVLVIIPLIIGFLGFYSWQITTERNRAQTEAQKAQEVKNLLVDLFKANDPILADGESVSLAGLLEAGTNQIRNRQIDPVVKSEMLLTLSTIYRNIEEYDKAMALADENLELNLDNFGANSINVAQSLLQLGNIEDDLGNYKEGKTYFLKAKKILEVQLSESDPLMANLYASLGNSEEHLSNYESSASYYQQSLDMLNSQTEIDSAKYIDVLRNVARSNYLSHYHIEDTQNAYSLYLLALEMSKDFHGENDVVTSSVMNDIGMFYMTQARYDEARKYYDQSLKIKDQVYGNEGHSNYSSALNNLAVLEKTLSNFATAESLFIRTLNMDLEIFGENHPNVAISKAHLADIYFQTEDYEKSRTFREEALEMYQKFYGPDHSYLGSMYRNYGQLLSVQGEHKEAEKYLIRTDSIYTTYLAPGDSRFGRLYHIRAENYYQMNKFSRAIPFYEQAAENYEAIRPRLYYWVRNATKCRIRLGQSYLALGNIEKAKSILNNLDAQIDTTEALTSSSEIQELYTKAVKNIESSF